MELRHHFSVPATVDTTWATFMDLAGVATCFPGATVTSADGDTFQGTCKVKLGPIAMMYAGAGSFVERDDAAHHAVIQATGKDKRGNGTAGATVTIALAPSADAGTEVDVTTDLAVTGKPAQFGRGVMQDVSDKLLGQFVACLEQRFAAGDTAGDPAGDAAGGSATDAAGEDAGQRAPVSEAVPAGVAVNGSEATVAAAGSEAAPAADRAPAAAGAGTPVRNVDRPAFTAAAPSKPVDDNALDLGATVLPVLLRSYAPQLLAGVAGFLLGVLVARSRRR